MARWVAIAAIGCMAALAAGVPSVHAQGLCNDLTGAIWTNYSVYRVSPASKAYLPGAVAKGELKSSGVLHAYRLICGHRFNADDAFGGEGPGTTSSGGCNASVDLSADVIDKFNASLGGRYLDAATLEVSNSVILEYDEITLERIRSTPACKLAIDRHRRSGDQSRIFQSSRAVIADLKYNLVFNAGVKASAKGGITSKLNAALGASLDVSSANTLEGKRIVWGVAPWWYQSWGTTAPQAAK